jgi:hypothetical protein
MKICSRYLDYFEQDECRQNSAQWQDLMAHTARCPDCASAMKVRSEMLETMQSMQQNVEIPLDLHERLLNEVRQQDKTAPDNDPWWENLFEKALRPLEIGFTLACLYMVFSLTTVDNSPEYQKQAKPVLQARKVVKQPPEKGKKLEEVSQKEIQQFLARLEEFNKRQAPAAKKPGKKAYMPELRLVNDWK